MSQVNFQQQWHLSAASGAIRSQFYLNVLKVVNKETKVELIAQVNEFSPLFIENTHVKNKPFTNIYNFQITI